MQVAFRSSNPTAEPVSQLTFYLASYNLTGEFLGFQKLANQLVLCSQTSNYATQSAQPTFLNVGNYFFQNCAFDMTALLDNTTAPTVFYEMFILDAHDDTLKPVPIRVRNFRTSDGAQVNKNGDDTSSGDIVDDILTRRFFMYDTISGRTSLGALQVVRWASSVTLQIVSQDNVANRIYPPVLTIEYEERQVADVVAAAAQGKQFVAATFETTYRRSLASFWHTALILLIVCMILALVRRLFFSASDSNGRLVCVGLQSLLVDEMQLQSYPQLHADVACVYSHAGYCFRFSFLAVLRFVRILVRLLQGTAECHRFSPASFRSAEFYNRTFYCICGMAL